MTDIKPEHMAEAERLSQMYFNPRDMRDGIAAAFQRLSDAKDAERWQEWDAIKDNPSFLFFWLCKKNSSSVWLEHFYDVREMGNLDEYLFIGLTTPDKPAGSTDDNPTLLQPPAVKGDAV